MIFARNRLDKAGWQPLLPWHKMLVCRAAQIAVIVLLVLLNGHCAMSKTAQPRYLHHPVEHATLAQETFGV